MSHYTSEKHIQELSDKVRSLSECCPKKNSKMHAKAILATSSDTSLPVEYRKQLLLRFLKENKEVEGAGY